MDYYPGSVTLPLDEYDELNRAYQDQDPMTRQERIDSTAHALVVCAGIGVVFAATAGAYYWLKDRADRRAVERRTKDEEKIENIPAP